MARKIPFRRSAGNPITTPIIPDEMAAIKSADVSGTPATTVK